MQWAFRASRCTTTSTPSTANPALNKSVKVSYLASMPKKSPRLDAFVDESIRGQTYYLCAVLISFERQSALRQQLRRISHQSGRRRIHFHSSSDRIRDSVIQHLIATTSSVVLVRTQTEHGVSEEQARQFCMHQLIKALQDMKVQRVLIESRSDNTQDYLTIQKARLGGPTIDFWHLNPIDEELLWAADALAWVAGAGPSWSRRLELFDIKFINEI